MFIIQDKCTRHCQGLIGQAAAYPHQWCDQVHLIVGPQGRNLPSCENIQGLLRTTSASDRQSHRALPKIGKVGSRR